MPDVLNMIRTICANGESGRLEILAGAIQGELSFKAGKLVDARVGHLTGFQAINAVASMQNARASFDPAFETLASGSIRPSERVVLKQFFGIDTEDAYLEPDLEPQVMSRPEEAAQTVPPVPVPETADEVTIVRTNSVPASLLRAPRLSFPTAAIFAALIIAMIGGAVVLINRLRDRSTPTVVAGIESSSGAVAASEKQPESPAEQPAAAAPVSGAPVSGAPKVKENPAPRPLVTAQNLSGKWSLVNTVETTSYQSFKNMKIGFHVSIDQNGNSFTGSGQKVSENGRPLPVKSRTPIQVKGSINGDRVEGTFFEEGTARKSNGRFVWRIDRAGRGLTGSFATTAARSRGKSAATRSL
jgi:hypothetical protein